MNLCVGLNNLPISLALAGLYGITWYLGVELTISLFLVFNRRRGLYFWSCALVAWGAILTSVFELLLEYCLWPDRVPACTLLFIAWAIMVVAQIWVLYSRLHLLMPGAPVLGIIKRVLVSTSVILLLPGLVIDIASEARPSNPNLTDFSTTWGRVQLVAFVIQETALCVLYMVQAHKYLTERSPLHERTWSAPSSTETAVSTVQHGAPVQTTEERTVLLHLTLANILIIVLDIASIAVMLANMSYLQAAVNSCVHAVKLKVEFSILNRLRDLVSQAVAPEWGVVGMGRREGPDSGVQLTHSAPGS
ncbi:hypothetical protein ASPCAL07162 [Aspergillus calidoustus]|uniref:DUF7703 domain-containing protein n=1 Tax=Aspergillus calidoustus TaxID=454130 RepID=A0A0U5G375_ASPCI|nr:hypothetical protein ASPCAL07162 [Aspergillus calidoustus]